MTVKELIAILETCPPDATVCATWELVDRWIDADDIAVENRGDGAVLLIDAEGLGFAEVRRAEASLRAAEEARRRR